MNMLEFYAEHGMQLFPVSPKTKKPAIKVGEGFSEATAELGALEKMAAAHPGCNWAMAAKNSGYVVIDVDEDGLEEWDRITKENVVPDTLTQISGSGIGRHLVFKAEPGVSYKKEIAKGIHVKHNGYIVVEPSVHPSGGQYKWIDPYMPVSDLPACLSAMMVRHLKLVTHSSSKELSPAKWENMVSMVEFLRNKVLAYDTWVGLGMIIHEETEGSEDGLSLYQHLTSGAANYEDGDDADAENKWDSFKKGGGLRYGSMIKTAMDFGFDMRLLKNDPTEDFEALPDPEPSPEPEIEWGEFGSAGHTTFVAESEKDAIFLFNKMGLCVVDSLGGWVAKYNKAENSLIWYKSDGRKTMFGPYKYKIEKVKEVKDDNGNKTKQTVIEYGSALTAWLGSIDKKTYTSIKYDHSITDEQYLNMWRELPEMQFTFSEEELVAHEEVVWQLINETLSPDNKALQTEVLQWLAHAVRYPHVTTTKMVVFYGEHGGGKNLWCEVLSLLFGDSYIGLQTVDEFLNPFNAQQARKLLTVIEDVVGGAKNEKFMSRLKGLSGGNTITINQKFEPQYELKHYSRILFCTNDDPPVLYEKGDRRWLLPKFKKKIDQELAAKIGTQSSEDCSESIDNKPKTAQALWRILHKIDLTGYKPKEKNVDIAEANFESEYESMPLSGKLLYEILMDTPVELWVDQGRLNKDAMYQHALRWARLTPAKYTQHSFWKGIYEEIGSSWSTGRLSTNERVLKITPTEMREAYLKTHPNFRAEVSFNDEEYVIGNTYTPEETFSKDEF